MALKKEVDFKGIVCKYHKVWSMSGEFGTESPNSGDYTVIQVKVALYKDAVTRELSVENFLRLKEYHFTHGKPSAPNHAEIADVYDSLKDSAEFNGSEDV